MMGAPGETAPHRPSSCSSDLPRRKTPAPQSGPAGQSPLPPSQACKGASPVTTCFFPTHGAPELSSCPRAFWVTPYQEVGVQVSSGQPGGPAPRLRLPVWAPPRPGWAAGESQAPVASLELKRHSSPLTSPPMAPPCHLTSPPAPLRECPGQGVPPPTLKRQKSWSPQSHPAPLSPRPVTQNGDV